jgi:hypothetical protein
MFSNTTITASDAATSHDHQTKIIQKQLADLWHIGLDMAEHTIQATTQLAICQAIHPIQCRFHTETLQWKYLRLGVPHRKFYTEPFLHKYHC